MAGLVHPQDPKEKIVRLQKGDFIQVPLGVVSWWYNDDAQSDLTILFLGDTSSALDPGSFTYFLLAGNAGIFTGFSTELVAKSLGVKDAQAREIFGSQPGVLIIKLLERLPGLEPCKKDDDEKGAVSEDGFSAEVVKLGRGAIWSPRYSAKPAVQVIAVVRGGGRFQIVGSDRKCVLDADAKEGEVLVVPKFFAASAMAGVQGMEWFSIVTSPL